MKKKASTIRDVARAAGVSPATVSRFTNGTLDLPAATAERIQEAIRELDYRPNVLARNLSLGRSRTLGLVLPDIANPFFAQLASAAERQASDRNYHLILCSTENNPDRELEYLQQLQAKRLDGIVFLTEHAGHAPLAKRIVGIEHLVLVDEGIDGFTGPRIFSDNRRGGELATRHLLELGYRRIGFIGGPPDLMTARERREGYLQALRGAGLEADPDLQFGGPYRQGTGREGLTALLALPDPPKAVFAASDATAIGVLREARERGLRVPDDLSLVGFDGIAIGELLSPPLTTVAQQIEELGRQGVRALLEAVEKQGRRPKEVRLPIELLIRDSTRPAT